MGTNFVKNTLQKRKQHEEDVKCREAEMLQNLTDISNIINDMLANVVHLCDSVIIQEIPYEKPRDSKRKSGGKSSQSVANINTDDITIKKGSVRSNKRGTSINKAKHKSNEFVSISSTLNKRSADDIPKRNIIEVSVGHEENVCPFNYFVSFDVIKNLLTTIFWNVTIKNIEDKSIFEIAEDLFNETRNLDFHSEVLAHEYLNNPKFLDLIKTTRKYLVKNPVEIVTGLIKHSVV